MKQMLSALLVAAASLGHAQVTTVEVFANSATHVLQPTQPPYVLKVYRLDAMAQIGQQITQQLPAGEEQAKLYMQQHEAQIRAKYKSQIVNAANGMSLAIHYKLDRVPAVVINRSSIIYGVSDVNQAVQLFLQSRGRQ
ncbi:TIGR03757 family integrating conjugative element protein [Comamonas sp. CMM01]|uniref:TIGR03757 family integrating conjugative element protein n=1 Tax=Comamonas sp. CMM01 TaxID=2769280 RepID=UPI00177D2DED|nr:TIGR03757 family integrating conjugative element protein [Comamonas sp. CMM01]MBD9534192.1 TIGR03757 family integrating conjugative element protein [Comamonas sp. CMM01]